MGRLDEWFAVYTHSRSEKKVSERFTAKGIQNFCPLSRQLRQWSDRTVWVNMPLIPSYVFVKITEDQMRTVRETPGVVNYVYWLGKPAIIPEREIDRLKAFLLQFPESVYRKSHPFEEGDEITIENGPLKGVNGIILSLDRKKARIALNALEIEVLAKINIEALKFNHAKRKV